MPEISRFFGIIIAMFCFQWVHLPSCPSEGQLSVFWTPDGKWRFMQKVILRVISITAQCKINHMVTRIFDAMGVGYNRLYFLRKS